MKNIFIIALNALFLLASCSKEDPAQFNQKITDAHIVSVNELTVPESNGNISLTMDITNEVKGMFYYSITMSETSPSAYDVISGNVNDIANGSVELTEVNQSHSQEVVGNPVYYVYSVVQNVNNEITPVVVNVVDVNDITSPFVLGDMSTPQSGGLNSTSPVFELYFSEEVSIADNFNMVVNSVIINGDELPVVTQTETISADNVSVRGNMVTVNLESYNFQCGNTLLVTASSGSFEDNSGNPSERIGWVHNGDEFVSIDYYFEMKDDTVNEVMNNFLGVNSVVEFIDGAFVETYNFNVELKECSESTVFLGGFFGVHNDVEFEFSLENTGIMFEEYQTAIFYDVIEEGFFLLEEGMELNPDTQFIVYFSAEDTYSGAYSVADNNFHVTYIIRIDQLGLVGTVMANYSRTAPAATASTQSVVIKSEYADAISAFKNR